MPPGLPQYIWMNGKLVPLQDATIHVATAAAFYATNGFVGVRIYWNDERPEAYAFRLRDHCTRWFESMKMMRFSVPYAVADLGEALQAAHRCSPQYDGFASPFLACTCSLGLGGGRWRSVAPTGMIISSGSWATLTKRFMHEHARGDAECQL